MDSRLALLERTLISGWSREDWRVFLFLADPRWSRRTRWRLAAQYWWRRWQILTILPGDSFCWMDRDLVGEVTAVKGRKVRVGLASGMSWTHHGPFSLGAYGEQRWFTKRDLESTWPWG